MKKKLFAAVISLVVATVMLTSASFAWFTVSTAPEINNVKVSMSATQNMEIARVGSSLTTPPANVGDSDSGDQTKYGGLVNDFATVALEIPAAIVTGNKNIGSAQYDTTGRTKGLVNATTGTLTNGVVEYKADVNGTVGGNDAKKCAAGYYVWLRTNTAGAVTAKISTVKTATGATEPAAASNDWTEITKDSANKDKIGIAFRVASLASDDMTAASGNTLAYYGKLTDQTYTKAVLQTTGDDVNKFTASIGSLPANTAVLVEMVVFADGANFTAEDVTNNFYVTIGNVAFNNAAITAAASTGAGSETPTST